MYRLRWFGHVMRSNGEINRVRSRPVPGRKGPGRPKKTWDECVKQDLKVCGLSEAGTQDRVSWRSSVKNSRQEPTPSNGSAPQSMAAPPARRVLGMRTRSFNKTGFDWFDWLIPHVPVPIVVPHCCRPSSLDAIVFGYLSPLLFLTVVGLAPWMPLCLATCPHCCSSLL